MRAELVRQFDVLGGIVAETIHAVGHGLLEESLHAVADFLVLGVEIPQAEQVAVDHLPTIAVIDCGAVIPRILLRIWCGIGLCFSSWIRLRFSRS